MKKKFTASSFLLFAGVLLFAYGKVFGGPLKSYSEVIGSILVFYPLLRQFGPPEWVKSMDKLLRRLPLLDKLPPPEDPTLGKASGQLNTQLLRKNVLVYTKRQIDKRFSQIQNPEIFKMDFMIRLQDEGALDQDKEGDWNKDEDFTVITGPAGMGKSFQLLKLVDQVCACLRPGLRNPAFLENKRIPLYIELRALNEDWSAAAIADYVQRASSSSKKKQIRADLLLELLNSFNMRLYFDGLDEIKPQYRKKCLDAIWEYNQVTNVVVTCRKEVYDEMVSEGMIPLGADVEEICIEALTPQQIFGIIDRVDFPPEVGPIEKARAEIKEFIGNKEKVLHNLSRSIILNLFLISYPELTEEEKQQLKTADEKKWLEILWRKCEYKLFKKEETLKAADILAIRTYMVWVAKIMQQSAFYIESIQPDWLRRIDKEGNIPEYRALQKLYLLVTRISTATAIGFALSLIISAPGAFLSNGIIGGMTIWVIAGIFKAIPDKTYKRYSNWLGVLFSIVLIASLIFVCGVYQGFSVPRANMTTPIFSLSETWPGIILGIVLSTMLSYRIIQEKENNLYILPVKLFHFNFRHALRYGISWGIVSGLITGMVALEMRHRWGGNLFLNNWLIPFLDDLSQKWMNKPLQHVDRAIFLYAFLFTFFVAGGLIFIFAGRREDREEIQENYHADNNEGFSRRLFGIFQTFEQAARGALRPGLLVTVIYMIMFAVLRSFTWYHTITIGLGVYLLSFLWYGGMEVANHAILRFTLFLRGITPWSFSTWVQNSVKVGLINQSSYKLSFYHDSLASYFADFPLKNNPAIVVKRRTWDLLYYWGIVVFFILMLGLPFYIQYGIHAYWKNPYVGVQVDPEATRRVNDSVYTIERSGKVNLSAGGTIYVGTFVGLVQPGGTKTGFMGMPLKNAYNLPYLDTFRHSALLYRIDTAERGWGAYPYRYVKEDSFFTVKKGDRLQVIVNDKEYVNNLFHYRLRLNFCDTCK